MSPEGVTQTVTRWGQATAWVAIAFLSMALLYGILPDGITNKYGTIMVVGWIAVVYGVGHFLIWER
ncbi:hypothetical protein [Natrialba aegyptia]|uniref:hypothetical protein n=1 Tax=Natrialba aegyptia TaxID=129789 RepID=UPI000677700B|nr:hypothetical protein [Natrialba aegyptia]